MLAIADEAELDRGRGASGRRRNAFARSARKKPVDELVRFVVGPDGEVVPDVKRKLPGRGIWITATRAAVEEAVKSGAFCPRLRRK